MKKLEDIFLDDIRDGVIHGAAVLGGDLDGDFCDRGFGFAENTLTYPMNTKTVIDIASVTKAAATVTALLVCHSRGWIDFDAPFTEYLKDFRAKLFAPVRIRDLANHTSGFGDVPPPDIPEFDESEILNSEKELLGFYVSGHPVAKYENFFKIFSTATVGKIAEGEGDVGVRVGGMIKSVARKISKRDGKLFAVIQFEDLTGSIECMAYPRVYEESKFLIHKDENSRAEKNEDGHIPEVTPVFIEAVTKKQEESSPVSLVAEKILTLEEALQKYSLELHVHAFEGQDDAKMPELLKLVRKHPGKTALIICIRALNGHNVFIEASTRCHVCVTRELLDGITHLLGPDRFRIKADDSVPRPRPKFQKPAWKEQELGELQKT